MTLPTPKGAEDEQIGWMMRRPPIGALTNSGWGTAETKSKDPSLKMSLATHNIFAEHRDCHNSSTLQEPLQIREDRERMIANMTSASYPSRCSNSTSSRRIEFLVAIGTALGSDVRARTFRGRNRTLAFSNLRANLKKTKALRAAFRLHVGTGVIEHAS